jgi:hypothetical protein
MHSPVCLSALRPQRRSLDSGILRHALRVQYLDADYGVLSAVFPRYVPSILEQIRYKLLFNFVISIKYRILNSIPEL